MEGGNPFLIFASSNKQHMNLVLANRLANQLMTQHGLTQQGWRFKYDSAKRRFGVCKYRYKVIALSAPLVELNDEAEIKDTILHEIAHALVGPSHGHDLVWKRKAIEIGCNGKRCCDSKVVATPESRYVAVCSGCNHTHKRHKKPNYGISHSCGRCSGGGYNSTFKLNWQVNPKF